LYVAQEKEYFQENGLDVELSRFSYDPFGFEKYAVGDLDGISIVADDTILLDKIYRKSRIVLLNDYTTSADFLFSKYPAISDLAGKKIGIGEKYSFSHFFVLKALATVDLTHDDVKFIPMKYTSMFEKFEEGEIDAGHNWITSIRKMADEQYFVLAESKDLPFLILDSFVFSEDFITHNPETIKQFRNAYLKALEYCQTQKNDCNKIISDNIGWSVKEVEDGFSQVRLLSGNESNDLLSGKDSRLIDSLNFVANNLVKLNQIENTSPVNDLIFYEEYT